MADHSLGSDLTASATEGFDLVVGRLESDLPDGATTAVNSSGVPETCAAVYCCISSV